ncbi:MAG: carbon-nitrogen hydrolase family protein [Gammaproteobacteria bacterium]|nr:carbon-nitrogen hydrolase family protein [Gammaproteobacteria bacterium]
MEDKQVMRVAAVQMESRNNDVAANIAKATKLIEEAVADGARLVLLPELATTGYELNSNIWNLAETENGITVSWLKALSKKHGIWLGASFLEAEGEEFYNTFVLTNPDGEVDGKVWKEMPGSIETYLFKGRKSNHIIETSFGRVGVLVCYDQLMAEPVKALARQSPDLILLPHSAAEPTKVPILFPDSAIQWMDEKMQQTAQRFSKLFGVPCVLANKAGPWDSKVPSPYPEQHGKFLGYSSICDSGGALRQQLVKKEGIVVADVSLDSTRKVKGVVVNSFGHWAVDVSWHFKWWSLVETRGRKNYAKNRVRKAKALEISNAW